MFKNEFENRANTIEKIRELNTYKQKKLKSRGVYGSVDFDSNDRKSDFKDKVQNEIQSYWNNKRSLERIENKKKMEIEKKQKSQIKKYGFILDKVEIEPPK
jgi:hypothetical protein